MPRLLAVSAVCLLALSTQLAAQTSAFTYQGALSQDGQPANGTYVGAELEQKQTEITELRQQNADLLQRLEALEARLR